MTEIAVIAALLVQFAGLVWGAASIKSAVDSLNDAVIKLSGAVMKLDDRVDAHDIEIAVLKARKEEAA